MQDMLHAVDDDWFLLAFDVNDALDPENVRTLEHGEDIDTTLEGGVFQWIIEGQADRANAIIVPVHIMAMKIGRENVWTPVTNAQLVCRLLLVKKNNTQSPTNL